MSRVKSAYDEPISAAREAGATIGGPGTVNSADARVMRNLQSARREAFSARADYYIDVMSGRPVYKEEMTAEMLADPAKWGLEPMNTLQTLGDLATPRQAVAVRDRLARQAKWKAQPDEIRTSARDAQVALEDSLAEAGFPVDSGPGQAYGEAKKGFKTIQGWFGADEPTTIKNLKRVGRDPVMDDTLSTAVGNAVPEGISPVAKLFRAAEAFDPSLARYTEGGKVPTSLRDLRNPVGLSPKNTRKVVDAIPYMMGEVSPAMAKTKLGKAAATVPYYLRKSEEQLRRSEPGLWTQMMMRGLMSNVTDDTSESPALRSAP